MLAIITLYHLLLILISLGLAYSVFKYSQTFWTYKVFKPFKWEQKVKANNISKELQKIEYKDIDKVRFHTFWMQIEKIKRNKIEGDFAELGVHKGYSANIIHKSFLERKLHLFDTFTGFCEQDLEKEKQNDSKYNPTTFSDTSIEEVKKAINGNDNLIFHKGYFPETAKEVLDNKFAFVHLDADLYQPTLEGLKFFYPRLAPEGVIIIHDYNHSWEGVRKAVDEFCITIPESIVELPDWQGSCLIVKNKEK